MVSLSFSNQEKPVEVCVCVRAVVVRYSFSKSHLPFLSCLNFISDTWIHPSSCDKQTATVSSSITWPNLLFLFIYRLIFFLCPHKNKSTLLGITAVLIAISCIGDCWKSSQFYLYCAKSQNKLSKGTFHIEHF